MSTRSTRRDEAVVIAGHRGDEFGARSVLDDPDPRLRSMALGALARMGSLALSDLVTAADDPAPVVRLRAAEQAGRMGGQDPRPVASALLHDADPMVVEMAAWALGEHPPRAADVRALSAVAVDHADPLCREAAVAALGALGDRHGLPAILTGTHDRATVRRRAVLALAAFAGPDVDRALLLALDDRDWQVRQAAEDLRAPDGGGSP